MARQYHVGLVAVLRHDRRDAVMHFPAVAMQEHPVGSDGHLHADAKDIDLVHISPLERRMRENMIV